MNVNEPLWLGDLFYLFFDWFTLFQVDCSESERIAASNGVQYLAQNGAQAIIWLHTQLHTVTHISEYK